jgi:hypothetical protein
LTYFQEQEQGHGEFSIENKEQTTPTTVQWEPDQCHRTHLQPRPLTPQEGTLVNSQGNPTPDWDPDAMWFIF